MGATSLQCHGAFHLVVRMQAAFLLFRFSFQPRPARPRGTSLAFFLSFSSISMPTTMRPSTRSTRSTRSLSEHASTKQSQVTARPSSVQLLLPQAQRIALESHNVGLNNTTSVSAAGKLGEHVTERKPRHRMNDRQLEQLETLYQRTTHPTKAEKSSLAREFDVWVMSLVTTNEVPMICGCNVAGISGPSQCGSRTSGKR